MIPMGEGKIMTETTILENSGDVLVFDETLATLFDETIKAIPQTQLSSPDYWVPGLDPAVSEDPYTHFKALRQASGEVVQYVDGKYGDVAVYNPFAHDLSTPNFAVLGYEAIREMVKDSDRFINSSAYGQHTKIQLTNGIITVNELDGEEHKQVRGMFDRQVFAKHFRTDFGEAIVAPAATHLCKRIRARLNAGEDVELNRDLSLPLLYITIGTIIGVPMERIRTLVEMGDAAFSGARDPQAAMAAIGALTAFFTERYEERKAADDLDTGDLMSAMSKANLNGRTFSPEEIVVYCRFLLPGGIETTWRQTANMTLAMMQHPKQFQEIAADEGLIPQAVEEICRWMASGFVVPRIAAKDTELAGVEIPAGSSMVGVFGVANHDERIWDNPGAFDIHRKRIPHLTFSTGAHRCMGQNLARIVVTEGLRALVRNLSDIELAIPADDVVTTGLQIRCPNAIPVRLKA